MGATVDLGGNVKIAIEGKNDDLVKFYIDKAKIADDDIRNGDNLSSADIFVNSSTNDGIYYAAVRHGGFRDLLCCYAIVGTRVYKSQQWRDIGPGEIKGGVPVRPIEPSRGIFVVDGMSGSGVFGFDKFNNTWNCIPGSGNDCVGSSHQLINHKEKSNKIDISKESPETDNLIKLTPENGVSDNEVVYNTSNGLLDCNETTWTGWYHNSNGEVYRICKDVNTGYVVMVPGGSTHAWGLGYTWAQVKSAYGLSGVTAYQSRCGGGC